MSIPQICTLVATVVIVAIIILASAQTTQFIAALNTISSPILAVVVICLGCGYSIISKKYGLDGNTAAGIVGAGIGLLTGQVLSATRTQTTDGRGPVTTQQTGAPAALLNGTPVVAPTPAPITEPPKEPQ